MGYLWTQYALDHLIVSLLFVHRPSLLFPSSPAPPFILPSWSVRIYCPHGLRSPAGLYFGPKNRTKQRAIFGSLPCQASAGDERGSTLSESITATRAKLISLNRPAWLCLMLDYPLFRSDASSGR